MNDGPTANGAGNYAATRPQRLSVAERLYLGNGQIGKAVDDIAEGLSAFHIWGMLGWQDVKQRYRRSVLGPFWLTISAAVMVTAIGLLYARILNQSTENYIPYLAAGLVVWFFLSSLVNEGCQAFIVSDQIIKQVRLPFTIHVSRVVWRNVIMFAHNSLILLFVALIYKKGSLLSPVIALPGLALILLNSLWVSLLLALLCARFRDIPQIIANLVQVTFFMTPILWHAGLLGNRMYLAVWNPFFHAIELIRSPLLGTEYPVKSLVFLALMLVVGLPITVVFFARYRARIPYWL